MVAGTRPVMMGQGRGRGRPPGQGQAMVHTPQRGMVVRGQPATRRPRMRSRVSGNPRISLNQQYVASPNMNRNVIDDDIIIPTLNSNFQAPTPDFDIIADDEIKHFDTGRDDTNIMNTSTVTSEDRANLARLPQFIQIEKVIE